MTAPAILFQPGFGIERKLPASALPPADCCSLFPKQGGEARTRLSEAEAYKQQRVADALGETSRFLALQKEYEKAPDVTRTRLYLEAMEKILPKLQLYIIDSDQGRVPLHLRVTGP